MAAAFLAILRNIGLFTLKISLATDTTLPLPTFVSFEDTLSRAPCRVCDLFLPILFTAALLHTPILLHLIRRHAPHTFLLHNTIYAHDLFMSHLTKTHAAAP